MFFTKILRKFYKVDVFKNILLNKRRVKNGDHMIVMLVEEKTFFFEIRKKNLVLTNSMAKDHLLKADLSYDGLSIGTCKIPNNMLNKLTITYQDEFRLQCVIFHI